MAKSTKSPQQKTECLNPRTGNCFFIETEVYKLFQKAIAQTLQANPGISFSEIVKGIKKCFKTEKVQFTKSIEWYGITVKMDMEARGLIDVYKEKAKKLHRLKK